METPVAAPAEKVTAAAAPEPMAANDAESAEPAAAPKRRSRAKKVPLAPEGPVIERQTSEGAGVDAGAPGADNEDGSGRRGWWQRTFGG